MPSYIVIAEDDFCKFHAESIIAYIFMASMINRDMHHMHMHHMVIEPIRKEDPVKIYKAIQEHYKVSKNLWTDVQESGR